jgi:cell division septum initiation protein DivIVA
MAKKKAKKTVKKAKKAAKSKKPTVAQRIANMKKEIQATKNKASREGQKLFKEAVKEIFNKFKGLERFSWNEYTPYWNDGDVCEFSVNMESLAVNEEVGSDKIEYLFSLEHAHNLLSKKSQEEARIKKELSNTKGKDKWDIERLKKDLEILNSRDPKEVEEKYMIKKTIVDLLGDIDDSVYQDMFGEGLVVVSREGITVEEYEHE